jgi:O-antigen ligase
VPPLRPLLAPLLAAAAIAYLALDGGGFFPRTWTIAAAALGWAAGMAVIFLRDPELGRAKLAWVGLLAAFVAWTAASITWSADPSSTVLEVRRGLVYVAAAAALALLARRGSAGPIVLAVWAATTGVVLYALVRYLLEPGFRDPAQDALLSLPVGYANALGILAGTALVLAVASPALPRRVAAASVAPLAAAIALTESRATLLAVAAGLAVVVALGGELLLAALPVAAVVFVLAGAAALADGTAASPGRAGAVVLLEVLVAAFLAVAPRVRLPRRVVVAAGAVLLAAALAWGGAHVAGGFRPSYWQVAWREYVAHPLLGSGGGSFGWFWARGGKADVVGGAALDAHNLYLETLAEVGPLGLLLLLGALALPLRAARRQPAAAGAYVAILAHAGLDWDWEMPVVMVAALALAAALLEDG